MRGEVGQKTFTSLKFRTQCPLVLPVKVARKEGKALGSWSLKLTEFFFQTFISYRAVNTVRLSYKETDIECCVAVSSVIHKKHK